VQVGSFPMPLHPPDSNWSQPLEHDGKQPADLA